MSPQLWDRQRSRYFLIPEEQYRKRCQKGHTNDDSQQPGAARRQEDSVIARISRGKRDGRNTNDILVPTRLQVPQGLQRRFETSRIFPRCQTTGLPEQNGIGSSSRAHTATTVLAQPGAHRPSMTNVVAAIGIEDVDIG